MNLHFVILSAYSASLILFGLWVSRWVRDSSDFFVAGRSLGPVLIFGTVMAANIGAGTTVGAASLGYRFGLSAWWWVGSAAIGTFVLAFWVGPRIHRIAADRGFYTLGDFLEYRYGASVRAVMTALLWVGAPAIMAAQLIALSVVLDVVIGMPRVPALVLGGVVMTTYFTAGGLRGAAWINLVQLVVLVLGFAFALAFALSGVGGWTGVASAAPAISPDYLNFWHGGGAGWALLALLVPNFIVSPGLLQKVYGARDAYSVKVGLGLCGAALLLFAFAPAVLGMVARLHYPELADPDHALPLLLRANVPLVVGAVGLGALFVADLSSADAVLFMLSTSMSRDLYHRFIQPQASDRSILVVARASAVAGGALAVGLAVASESIISALSLFYSLIAVSLFVPVIAGLYSRRGGAPEVFASVAAGIGVMLAVSIATDNAGFGVFTPNISGLMAAAVGFGCVAVARALGRTAAEANTSETQ